MSTLNWFGDWPVIVLSRDSRVDQRRVAEANLLFSSLTTELNNSCLAAKRCVCDMIHPFGLDKFQVLNSLSTRVCQPARDTFIQ